MSFVILFPTARACGQVDERRLAGEGAPWNGRVARVGCGVPIYQIAILQERDSGNTADAVGRIAAVR